MFSKVLFKNSIFSPNERFSKALFQSNLDIAFLIFSILAFYNPRPLARMLEEEVQVSSRKIRGICSL